MAKIYFEKACNLDVGLGCSNLGFLYAEGKGVRQDISKAVQYCEKGCSLKEGFACNSLGELYEDGIGIKNKTTAKEYYGKACDLGDQQGCDNYRKLNEQGY